MSTWNGFRGAAKRLEDMDLPRVGHAIGVGEDEIHAFMDVESRGAGFDALGRPKILFEAHVFYRALPKEKRGQAQAVGLAAPKWGQVKYGKESEQYGRLERAMAIDETAALKACSWGLMQVLGENYRMVGYDTVQDFVRAMMEDEDNHLEAAVEFIKAAGIDDDLRAHRWAVVARVYNGPGYAKNQYDTKMAKAFQRWQAIKDTAWQPEPDPAKEAPGPSDAPSPAPTPSKPRPIPTGLAKWEVEALQKRLRELGYFEVGKVDGIMGTRTTAAISAFQHENGLQIDGCYGPQTKAALANAKPRVIAPERLRTTAADLVAQGSGVAIGGKKITFASAVEMGVMAASLVVFVAGNWQTTDLPFPLNLATGFMPPWAVPLLAMAFAAYKWAAANGIISDRVQAERMGLHNGEPDPAPSPPVTQPADGPGAAGSFSFWPTTWSETRTTYR